MERCVGGGSSGGFMVVYGFFGGLTYSVVIYFVVLWLLNCWLIVLLELFNSGYCT